MYFTAFSTFSHVYFYVLAALCVKENDYDGGSNNRQNHFLIISL